MDLWKVNGHQMLHFIIAEPVMKMIATMGMKAGVKNIRIIHGRYN